MQLSSPALRVLGALIEKALATPQGYPLSLNALRIAANQSTGRDPVTDYIEGDVREAVQELTRAGLVKTVYANRSNTPKYAHTLDDYLEIGEADVAALAILMLRGPQTLGEIRQRSDRLHTFAELTDVAETLEDLAAHPLDRLVAEMPRQPGQKETRWCHLLGDAEPEPADAPEPASVAEISTAGSVPVESSVAESSAAASGSVQPRVVATSPHSVRALEEEVAALRDDLETLQAEVERLRRSLEP